jgi:hypothetical protein
VSRAQRTTFRKRTRRCAGTILGLAPQVYHGLVHPMCMPIQHVFLIIACRVAVASNSES